MAKSGQFDLRIRTEASVRFLLTCVLRVNLGNAPEVVGGGGRGRGGGDGLARRVGE